MGFDGVTLSRSISLASRIPASLAARARVSRSKQQNLQEESLVANLRDWRGGIHHICGQQASSRGSEAHPCTPTTHPE